MIQLSFILHLFSIFGLKLNKTLIFNCKHINYMDKQEYKDFLKNLESTINDESLKYLFKCFYSDLDSDVDKDKILNMGLNLFFGNFDYGKTNENEDWKNNFKNSIREKYEVIKTNKDGKTPTKYKLKDPSKKTLESLSANTYIVKAKEQWLKIREGLSEFFEKIKKPINKTLIYEAPPYLLSIVEKSDSVETNFEAEFIFHPDCSSPYVNAIKNCFDNKKDTISDILAKNGVGFFDVIPIPIPINSDLRTLWAVDEKFIIECKRIFVHFFEWALKIYIFKLGDRIDKDNHKIAIGIPLKNAVTLYEYHSEETNWFVDNYISCIDFSEGHSFNAKNKKPLGLWVQQYKNCIIGSSNTPSGQLMKIAFKDAKKKRTFRRIIL